MLQVLYRIYEFFKAPLPYMLSKFMGVWVFCMCLDACMFVCMLCVCLCVSLFVYVFGISVCICPNIAWNASVYVSVHWYVCSWCWINYLLLLLFWCSVFPALVTASRPRLHQCWPKQPSLLWRFLKTILVGAMCCVEVSISILWSSD